MFTNYRKPFDDYRLLMFSDYLEKNFKNIQLNEIYLSTPVLYISTSFISFIDLKFNLYICEKKTNFGYYWNCYGRTRWNFMVLSREVTSNNVMGFSCTYFISIKQEKK